MVGARPQFIKAAAVSPALREAGIVEQLIHTGQHYDYEMSQVFFDGLNLPRPAINLGVGSASHGAQTGRMLEKVEEVLLQWEPDLVLVYGDTNSTLAGALAPAKLRIPVAQVEAGLRSFDPATPEEINRVLTDHLTCFLFAPNKTAVANLQAEGIRDGVVLSGDVMIELLEGFLPHIEAVSCRLLDVLSLRPKAFVLVTVPRAENTDDPARWGSILKGIKAVAKEMAPIVWPVHPRVRERLATPSLDGVILLEPRPYLETQVLARSACLVLTDSGGLQKEAAFHGTPCLVLRDRTEWVELERTGLVCVAGIESQTILKRAQEVVQATSPATSYPERGEVPPSRLIAKTLATGLARGTRQKALR